MVTKSSSTTLLSRFTHLFRESDADDDSHSRQSVLGVPVAQAEPTIKDRLERKRRNDAIKLKELNHLRAILQAGRGIKRPDFIEAGTPSALVRTSEVGKLERHSILDKIDGAEAHLENWWGTTTVPAPIATAPLERGQPAAGSQAPILNPSTDTPAAFIDDMDLDFTAMLEVTEQERTRPEPIRTAPMAIEEVTLTALESCLRDAALHHAEGEFDEARQLLANLLRDTSLAPEAAESLTFALFDVYRCTGQQNRFDALALDYASRFGRSPGEWFSLAELAAPPGPGSPAQESRYGELAQETTWKCPAILDKHGLADCISRNSAAAPVSFISWEGLQHIDNSIASAFAVQLKTWCEQPVELQWAGMDALLAAVQMCKVSDDSARDAAWWLIHLELLRIQQQTEAYEELALEYCIAFEVSPPGWQPALCTLAKDGDFPASTDFATTAASSNYGETVARQSPYANCQLQGHLTGEARRALRTLRTASGSGGNITVSCGQLGRVDFNAASAILNWAASSNARGCQVQFICLPRLVLVFFEMLGMHKVASLSSGAN
jgi:ABC-type transporter Mla MlaB component